MVCENMVSLVLMLCELTLCSQLFAHQRPSNKYLPMYIQLDPKYLPGKVFRRYFSCFVNMSDSVLEEPSPQDVVTLQDDGGVDPEINKSE